MVRWLGEVLSRWSVRWVPDPFVIAILLTLVTLGLAMLVTGVPWDHAVGHWGGRLKDGELIAAESGLWKFLRFGMQMCLILVTGHALASAPAVKRAVARVAGAPKTAAQAVALTAVVAMLAGWVNWGLGLIIGALMARDVGRLAEARKIPVHYPLLGAAGYTALLVWHAGMSGSAPLKVTQAQDIKGLLGTVALEPIALTETIFSAMNLTWFAVMLVAVPALLCWMLPREASQVRQASAFGCRDDDGVIHDAETEASRAATPAGRLENSPVLSLLLAALAFGYLTLYLGQVGVARIDLNSINLLFIGMGLVLHGSPMNYGRAVGHATSGCSGIILQFPFYAGIMGIMQLSGLVDVIAQGLVSVATVDSHGVLTFLSAGAVNLFVPSGGGQWGIQGGLVIETAQQLGVEPGKAIMAFCYGDQWTNMLQPFWALPLLGITGLKAGDLIGYSGSVMLLTAPIFITILWLF